MAPFCQLREKQIVFAIFEPILRKWVHLFFKLKNAKTISLRRSFCEKRKRKTKKKGNIGIVYRLLDVIQSGQSFSFTKIETPQKSVRDQGYK